MMPGSEALQRDEEKNDNEYTNNTSSSSTSSSSTSRSSSSSSSYKSRTCRVCSDERSLFSSMRQLLMAKAKENDNSSTDSDNDIDDHHHEQHNKDTIDRDTSDGRDTHRDRETESKTSSANTFLSSGSLPVPVALPCPPNATILGRGTWTFLHSIAAYYPQQQPSQEQQQQMKNLLLSLPYVYPCHHCAEHLSLYYKNHSPISYLTNRLTLSQYLCRLHNAIRRTQGKKLFDCSRVEERWGGEDWEDKYGGKQQPPCDEQRPYGDVDSETER